MMGVEPITPALRKPCSAIELHRHTRPGPGARIAVDAPARRPPALAVESRIITCIVP